MSSDSFQSEQKIASGLSEAQSLRVGCTFFVLCAVAIIATIVYYIWFRDALGSLQYWGLVAAAFAAWFSYFIFLTFRSDQAAANAINQRIATAEKQIAETSARGVAPAWELARITLERYWTRNLWQNNLVFAFSLGAVLAGFLVVVWSIYSSLARNDHDIAWIGTLAGAITQLVGTGFLLIYRSTVEQAGTYTATLERINAVGMALAVLETMSEDSPEAITAKSAAKAEIISRVLQPG